MKTTTEKYKAWKKKYNKAYYQYKKKASGKLYHKRKCPYCKVWYIPRFKHSKACSKKQCQILRRKETDRNYRNKIEVKEHRKEFDKEYLNRPLIKLQLKNYRANRYLDKKEKNKKAV